jgi:hypothetical protein
MPDAYEGHVLGRPEDNTTWTGFAEAFSFNPRPAMPIKAFQPIVY